MTNGSEPGHFFIPLANSDAQRDHVYDGIKENLKQQLGAVCSSRRIHSLRWWHERIEYAATVGQVTSFNNELVIAILFEPDRDLYHVCTPNRGVATGGSILAGAQSVITWRDFAP